MQRLWKDHSLSVTFVLLGVVIVIGCIPLREGTSFDLISGIGSAFFTTGLYGLASGPLVEKNKPEQGE